MNPIKEAAERLPGHWHQGSSSDENGNYCGLGHLWNVTEDFDVSLEDEKFSIELMGETARELFPERNFKSGAPSFALFNDHPDTTEDEVVSVMEKAAVRYDERI